ncbi:protein kinase subdomain-containing protein PKL ccin3 [Lentinula edodes]|uniref:Protein kinase subdomain-containing protein PKL ccin3 n=1 Tax=Lentinula edodes TaxID=5353 RepID=A0A1Q3EAX6_LENED|nr:protein kinase subdomain-containing protein PKL ccin3 [Lentinula edodes]
MTEYLPINALSAVILVAGKVESEDEEWIGPKVPVVLYRQVPPPASTLDDDYTREEKLNFYDVCPPYPDPPFELPLPAGLTLHVSLGKLLSEGRTGMIFELFDYFDFGPMSLLVIEKLGGLLELGKPLPNGAESDLNDVGSGLAKLHILHSDLRWENILFVLPPSEGGLPSLPSPFTGKIYGWRLVDFDQAKRTTHHITFAQGHYIGHIERVLSCIPMGIPVQPWE